MSHMTKGTLVVQDLECLAEAGVRCGLRFMEGQTTHEWYRAFMNDSAEGRALAAERGVHSFGKCEHAMQGIDHKKGDYEIGVVKAKDGNGYELVYDRWGPGAWIEQKAGYSLGKLKQEYAAAVAKKAAQKKLRGWTLERETLPNGRLRVRARKR